MKKELLALGLLACGLFIQAHTVKINTTEPGTLRQLLAEQEQPVAALEVTGRLNADDLLAIGKQQNLQKINLRGAKFKALPDSAFYGMTSLTEVRLPRKMAVMGRSAFEGCTQLMKVEMPEKLKALPEYAFKDCERLDKMVLYREVRAIRTGAFMNSGIHILILPELLEHVGVMAFANCSRLERLRLPRWVNQIESMAFANCTALRAIGIGSDAPPVVAADIFTGMGSCVLHVKHPEQYRDRAPWSQLNLAVENYNGEEIESFDKSDIEYLKSMRFK